MVTTPDKSTQPAALTITWERLPDTVPLDGEPVDNTGQPLIAEALREALELTGYIQPQMLMASNFGICATLNGKLVIKAPDWVYVPTVMPLSSGTSDRRSYTPNLDGDIPSVVMEFLSETEGGEYSVKPTYPPGKWFFYEHILQVPTYAIFDPALGNLEVYHLQARKYELATPNADNRYWIAALGLFLGTWQGTKEARNGYWLRWWDESGSMLLWAVEQVEQVDQARQQVEQERQRAERMAIYLRSQGIDPDLL